MVRLELTFAIYCLHKIFKKLKEFKSKYLKTLQFSNVLSWSMMVLLLTINIIAISDNLKTETSQDSLIESIASDFGFQDQETDYLNQN